VPAVPCRNWRDHAPCQIVEVQKLPVSATIYCCEED
jgi:hypothetical protein